MTIQIWHLYDIWIFVKIMKVDLYAQVRRIHVFTSAQLRKLQCFVETPAQGWMLNFRGLKDHLSCLLFFQGDSRALKECTQTNVQLLFFSDESSLAQATRPLAEGQHLSKFELKWKYTLYTIDIVYENKKLYTHIAMYSQIYSQITIRNSIKLNISTNILTKS